MISKFFGSMKRLSDTLVKNKNQEKKKQKNAIFQDFCLLPMSGFQRNVEHPDWM